MLPKNLESVGVSLDNGFGASFSLIPHKNTSWLGQELPADRNEPDQGGLRKASTFQNFDIEGTHNCEEHTIKFQQAKFHLLKVKETIVSLKNSEARIRIFQETKRKRGVA